MKNNSFKSKLFFLFAIGFSIFLLFFVVGCIWIGYEVKNTCQEAQRQYDGNCTQSLIALLQDEDQPFRSRNNAVWALGELGNREALPILQQYYTGNIPDREPLDKTLSQYELKKAVNLTGGGLNITAPFWRYNLD